MPKSVEFEVLEADKKKVMHVSLPIGVSTLMGSDTGGEWAPAFVQGNNFSVSVTVDSKAEADKTFNALVKGGQITMPLASTFWGDYFGILIDKFGINWMISFNEQEQKE